MHFCFSQLRISSVRLSPVNYFFFRISVILMYSLFQNNYHFDVNFEC